MLRFKATKFAILAALCLLGTGFAWSSYANGETYTFTDLGPSFGGPNSAAYGINNAGQVVGWSDGPGGYEYATLWSGGTTTNLGFGPSSIAHGINNSAAIAGIGDGAGGALLWTGGTLTYLGSGGAIAINNSGTAVGYSPFVAADIAEHATLWTGGSVVDLGALPGGALSWAGDVNDGGQVVGWSTDAAHSDGPLPALWSGGAIIDLGSSSIGGVFGTAEAINDSGQVVGWSANAADTVDYATLWYKGAITNLGGLPASSFSVGNAINDAGLVVGQSEVADAIIPYHAILWSGGSIIDLNSVLGPSDSGWTLEDATGINAIGQIVGYGVTP